MNTRCTVRAALLCLGALLFTSPILAQKLAPQVVDARGAQVLFEEGRQALERKDFALACAKFRASYQLQAAAGTAMNWATCDEQLGHVASAWWRWHDAISKLRPGDDRIAYAKRQVRRLDSRLPYLSVRLAPAAPLQTTVLRDGISMSAGQLGLTVPIDPGEHRISVSAPGYDSREFSIRVDEREQKELIVEPGARRSEPEVVTRGATPTPTTQRTVGWIVCGVGVVGFATAAVTGLMLPAKEQAVSNNCTGNVCNQRGLDAAHTGKTLLTLNTVGGVVGIVGGGLGAYLVISSASSAQDPARTAVGVTTQAGALTVRYAGAF